MPPGDRSTGGAGTVTDHPCEASAEAADRRAAKGASRGRLGSNHGRQIALFQIAQRLATEIQLLHLRLQLFLHKNLSSDKGTTGAEKMPPVRPQLAAC